LSGGIEASAQRLRRGHQRLWRGCGSLVGLSGWRKRPGSGGVSQEVVARLESHNDPLLERVVVGGTFAMIGGEI